MAFPYQSPELLERHFTGGLERMLRDEDGVGPYVLVLNNALFDHRIGAVLGADLEARFEVLAARCRELLAAGTAIDAPEDDRAVFLALMGLGYRQIAPVARRDADGWQLQLNRMRSLRPARTAGEAPATNRAAFAPDRFHFDRPFLRREAFWRGTVDGVHVDLLYNKFPFARYHGLLVPEPAARRPQWLDRNDHELVWRLAIGAGVAGFGVGYNSYGACASINHLHFQTFADPSPLPVEADRWRHNGGDRPYPAGCEVYTDPASAWGRIDALQLGGTSFNLLYRPGRLYCLPRRRQGQQLLPQWCVGLAWLELCGGFVVPDEASFADVTGPQLADMLAAARLSD
jgi:hypothetical protein